MKILMCTCCGEPWPPDQRACLNCGNLQSFRAGKKLQDDLSSSYIKELALMIMIERERDTFIAQHGKEAWAAKVAAEIRELYQ